MKVQELRDLLKSVDRERLEKAFAEIYKQFPKNKKEEIDQLITAVFEGDEAKRPDKRAVVDFGVLEMEIKRFIQNAYEQNYGTPNKVIPKNQRPKWRFMVKNYIKELSKIPADSGDYPASAKLLADLYQLLCHACDYYVFSTEDPFRSVGWQQPDLFHLVAVKTFGTGYTRENIASMALAATTGGLSMESLHVYQMWELVAELKTSDVKYMAIEEAKKIVEEKKKKLAGLKEYSHQAYGLREDINHLCELVLSIAIELAEPDTEIDYFFKNCQERDREVVLYRALDLANDSGDDKLWMHVYEYGLSKKIKPRDSLKKEYQERKGKDS